MDIMEITGDRRRYMPILLIGDEQEVKVCFIIGKTIAIGYNYNPLISVS